MIHESSSLFTIENQNTKFIPLLHWYYQLKATTAIFPKTNNKNEYSRFQHLGKAGSQAHIDGVLAVARRVQIDELTKAIDGLNESWSDLYSNEEKVGHRVE